MSTRRGPFAGAAGDAPRQRSNRRAARWRAALARPTKHRWRATDALRRGVVLGTGLVVIGVLTHRLEVLLLGAPLLVASLLAAPAGSRASVTPSVTVRPLPHAVEAGESTTAVVEVVAGAGELLAVRLPTPDRPGPGPVHLLPATGSPIGARLRRDAWGEGIDLRADHLVAGPDALFVFGPVTGVEGRRVVLPPLRALPAGPLPPRAAGLVGAHRARRPGDGTELRNIRPFQPGDRLRRIDWRVSLRSAAEAGGEPGAGVLHVRERHAEADADVVLAVDTRVDVGADVAGWSSALRGNSVRAGGSLDTAVRAAVSLAASYLWQGDRVSLADLGRPQLGVRPGVGRRQLLRLRNQLVVCARSAGWAARPVLHAQQVPHGALVVVLSPFLDDAAVEVTVHAARRGNLVLAVDVLPAGLLADRSTPWGDATLRILELEHETRLAALRGHGIAVVPWADGGTVAAVLRRAAQPRRRVGVSR
ncbi:DUF58 domain-containing protein [Solihabitans fulvus]|uniref:DUF58 domain-containing protein n=1 Tax=Solihabitans fulvus TaxID=1892852 RepID=A0A5B2XJX3_9PSEU|nr:DUF58 domain-containing protein [Solihabitans fulvus]KAA2263269.1 DUF58 domain-containing protein [Solihabitans fulvus]